MSQVLFATQNKHKQQEVSTLFKELSSVELLFPKNFPNIQDLDPEETGETFHQNAEIKAQTWFDQVGITVVAEDTGLEVEALDGKPGVHSKRFFPGSDTDRNNQILKMLVEADSDNRKARFITVACLILPGQKQLFFEGIIHGSISNTVSSGSGFGYDPIFVPDGYTDSFAVLGQQVKNELSSRAKAVTQVITYLATN